MPTLNKKVGDSSMAATSVGEIGLDLVINSSGFNRQVSKMESLAKKAGATFASAFAVKKLADFGSQCIKLGSDLAEVQNVVDVTFSSMSADVDKFAKSAINNFGLSETMAKQYTGTFGAMAKAFGFAEDQAYNMSTTLTGLAGDVASFYNLSQDEAYTKLKSVFTGETESLKDLGVVMTQTALDNYALANGFGVTTSAMSEQEKVALRYQFVLNQLSLAQGDFTRTSDSWANQTRIMALQIQSIMASIGQGLINLFTPAIKMINALLAKIAQLAEAFKGFTELITGKKSGGGSGITDTLADAAIAAGDAGSGLANAADQADNLADNAGAVGSAAKKAAKEMRSLMGFDEINKLVEQTDTSDGTGGNGGGSSPGGGGTGGSGLAGLGSGATDFGQLAEGENAADKLSESLDKLLKLADPTITAMKKLYNEGFQKLEEFTWGTIKDFWNNFLKPMGEWYIGDDAGLPRFFNITNDLLNEINWDKLRGSLADYYTSLQNIAKFKWTDKMNFYESFLKPVATWTMSDAIPELVDELTKFNNKVNWDYLNSSLDRFYGVLAKMVTGIGQGAVDFVKDFHIADGAAAAVNGFAGGLEALSKAVDLVPETVWNGVGAGLAAVATSLIAYKTMTTVGSTLTKIGTGISNLVASAAEHPILAAAVGVGAISAALYTLYTEAHKTGFEADLESISHSISNLSKTLSASKIAADSDYSYINDILDKYMELNEKLLKNGSLNGSDESMFQFYHDELTKYSPDIQSLIGEIGTAYTGTKDALQELIDKQHEQVLESAYQEVLSGYMKSYAEASTLIITETEKLRGELTNLGDYSEAAIDNLIDSMNGVEVENFADDFDDLFRAATQSISGLQNYGNQLEEARKDQDAATEGINACKAAIKQLEDETSNAASSVSSSNETINESNSGMADKTSNFWTRMRDNVSKFSQDAEKKAKDAWNNIGQTVTDKNKAIADDTDSAWSGADSSVSKSLGSMLLSTIGNMASMLLQMGTNAVIQSNTEGAWKSMDDTITTALDAWPDDTKTALDSIVAESTGLDSRVQTAMGNFYSVGQTAAQSLATGFKSVHIPSPKFSVGTVAASAAGVGFSLPNVNVSWLAQGGYVKANTPQLAMIGDNRHQGEVVAPEDKLLEMARKAASGAGSPEQLQKIISLLETLISLVQGGDDIVLAVDGEELARAMITGSLRLKRRHSTVTVTV